MRKQRPSLTCTLVGLFSALMACQTRLSKKAWNSLITPSFLWKGTKRTHRTRHAWPSKIKTQVFPCIHVLNFKLKIVTWLAKAKKEDGPMLFSLMAQCFLIIGLIEWTNVVGKQCPNKTYLTKENFDKCLRDYFEAIAGFPNGFFYVATPRSPHSCQCMSSCGVKCSYSATLTAISSIKHLNCPRCKRKWNKSFLCSWRRTSLSSLWQTKWCPGILFHLCLFSSSARLPTRLPVFLTNSRWRKNCSSQPWFEPLAPLLQELQPPPKWPMQSRQLPTQQLPPWRSPRQPPPPCWEGLQEKSPLRKKFIANAITTIRRKRSCTMITPPPSLSLDSLSGKRSCSLSSSPSSSCSCSCSCLSSSKKSHVNHHTANQDHKKSKPLNHEYLYLDDEDNGVHQHEKGGCKLTTFTASFGRIRASLHWENSTHRGTILCPTLHLCSR